MMLRQRKPLKRGKPLPRATKPLGRSQRVKATNPRRKRSEFARCYGSRARVAFVKALPCVVRNCAQVTRSDNAHVGNGGMGRKADARHIVPICRWHHTQSRVSSLHALGKQKFNAYHGLDLDAEAALIESAFPSNYITLLESFERTQ
jgi:hypothetical protein